MTQAAEYALQLAQGRGPANPSRKHFTYALWTRLGTIKAVNRAIGRMPYTTSIEELLRSTYETVPEAQPEPLTEEEAAALKPGNNVCITTLESRPELAGKLAMVTQPRSAQSGRAAVQVEGEPKPMALKPSSLTGSGLPVGARVWIPATEEPTLDRKRLLALVDSDSGDSDDSDLELELDPIPPPPPQQQQQQQETEAKKKKKKKKKRKRTDDEDLAGGDRTAGQGKI